MPPPLLAVRLVAEALTNERLEGAFVLLSVCRAWKEYLSVDLESLRPLARFTATMRHLQTRPRFAASTWLASTDARCRPALLPSLWTPSGRWTDSCVRVHYPDRRATQVTIINAKRKRGKTQLLVQYSAALLMSLPPCATIAYYTPTIQEAHEFTDRVQTELFRVRRADLVFHFSSSIEIANGSRLRAHTYAGATFGVEKASIVFADEPYYTTPITPTDDGPMLLIGTLNGYTHVVDTIPFPFRSTTVTYVNTATD